MNRQRLFLFAALCIGVVITWVDQSPGWDDTGISVMLVFLSSGLLGALSPRRPWRWALAVGLGIPIFGILRQHNFGSILALVIALAGAYLGMAVRQLFLPITPETGS